MAQRPVLWEELTWEQIAALRDAGTDTVILPVGATEQHGRHLPTGVDTFSAVAVAHGASALTGIPVLPALPYGVSLGHSPAWPGTLSLRPETLSAIVLQLAEWLHAAGFKRIVMLNGHVTNWAPLRCGLENIRHTYPDIRIALKSLWELSHEVSERYHRDARGFHANAAETSLMLHLRPELVRRERIVDEPDRSACCFFAYRVDQESVTGVTGNPSEGTAEAGTELLTLCIAELAKQLQKARYEKTPLEERPPPL